MTFVAGMKRASLPAPRRLALIVALGASALIGTINFSQGLTIYSKAIVAQVLLEKAWRQTLAGAADVKPWPWADIWPVLKIEAVRLDEASIVLSGVSGQAMAFGPGLMEGTAKPGDPGLAIIAAHRDTHFSFLKDIRIGDEIIITNADGRHLSFTVSETRIVNANKSGLYADSGGRRIALVTCWPFDAAQQGDERFVVLADLMPA